MLTDKLNKWKEIELQIKHLKEMQSTIAAEISEEVLALGKTQKANGVRATYTAGRGNYNYQEAVNGRGVDPDLMRELLTSHEKVSYEWKKIAEALALDDDYLKLFYTPGTPSVTLKLED